MSPYLFLNKMPFNVRPAISAFWLPSSFFSQTLLPALPAYHRMDREYFIEELCPVGKKPLLK
jgi:hypothetical protein